MNNIFKNIRGTTRNLFKIGSVDFHTSATDPDTSDGENGSWWFGGTGRPSIHAKHNDEWSDVTACHIETITGVTHTHNTVSTHDVLVCENTEPLEITIDTMPPIGYRITIKDGLGGFSTNTLTVTGLVAIDGSTTTTLDTNYESITLVSDGESLLVI